MRSKILILVALISLTFTGLAAMPPAPSYCEHMGYNYTHLENGSQSEGVCRFGENESCEAGAFLNGECGQKHVRNISCREGGETVFIEFESCCGDMKPYFPPGASGQPICQPEKSLIEKISLNVRTVFRLVGAMIGL